MAPSESLRRLKDYELADLLYRDHLVLKHSSSESIGKAIRNAQHLGLGSGNAGTEATEKTDSQPLSVAIVEFLVQAAAGRLCLVQESKRFGT